MVDIIQTLFSRRSVRRYAERPLEPERITCLLEAAMCAPTACNSQPWEFVVVTEPEVLDRLREKLLFARYNAPCAITVCGNIGVANNSAAKHYWVQDCSAAMENLLIAAAGMGLGAVWIGVYPLPSVIKPVTEILNLPETVIPLGIALTGYPAEGAVPPPRTQYDPHRVHWQIYEPRKPHAKKKNTKYLE
jgi:nitroreductase